MTPRWEGLPDKARPRAQVKDQVATDPAVAKLLAEVDALSKTVQPAVAPVVDPFARTKARDPFASHDPFAAKASTVDVFAKGAFAKPKIDVFAKSKISSAFKLLPSKAFSFGGGIDSPFKRPRGKIINRQSFWLRPQPPAGTPQPQGYHVALCEWADCFEYDELLRVDYGVVIDMNEARESMGWRCINDGHECAQRLEDLEAEEAEADENEEDAYPLRDSMARNGCPHHPVEGAAFTGVSEVLNNGMCEHMWFEDIEETWKDVVNLMRMLRAQVLDEAEAIIELPGTLDWIFTLSRYQPTRYERSNPEETILRAIDSGVTDSGIAAAFADAVIEDMPEIFGMEGVHLAEAWRYMKYEGYLPKHPEVRLIANDVNPTDHQNEWWATLVGNYRVSKIDYYSTLVLPDAVAYTTGMLGWHFAYMDPIGLHW